MPPWTSSPAATTPHQPVTRLSPAGALSAFETMCRAPRAGGRAIKETRPAPAIERPRDRPSPSPILGQSSSAQRRDVGRIVRRSAAERSGPGNEHGVARADCLARRLGIDAAVDLELNIEL